MRTYINTGRRNGVFTENVEAVNRGDGKRS